MITGMRYYGVKMRGLTLAHGWTQNKEKRDTIKWVTEYARQKRLFSVTKVKSWDTAERDFLQRIIPRSCLLNPIWTGGGRNSPPPKVFPP